MQSKINHSFYQDLYKEISNISIALKIYKKTNLAKYYIFLSKSQNLELT